VAFAFFGWLMYKSAAAKRRSRSSANLAAKAAAAAGGGSAWRTPKDIIKQQLGKH
jgi:hypothetical protein